MSKFVGICLLGLLLATIMAAEAQMAPSPAAADCSTLVLNMADCLSFVTSGSTVQNPEGTCCDGLKQVIKADGECLCEVLKNSAQIGLTLNVTKAVSLPAACGVSAPSVSNCGPLSPVAMAPGGSVPAPSPAPVPPAPASATSGSEVVSASFGMMAITIACLVCLVEVLL